ncbi:variable surface protein Vir14/32-related [Plasmodium vivax]|uniref:Variable surface protein Vir14/32-related n=1 Tax=Plasmodium vivax (strain Salvador I) TaxID=126793 RepID=A5KDC6_PLAVS|nr:variable surface protein Vir14/32-related [Plasmodium vivax]EDL42643.1 variable surface protein Vir14/32-related [Plasmodium vivax]|eukprot:XP_001612436.1 variable surface protein Vir14/32-related [Plasmodium vivax Sal-1]
MNSDLSNLVPYDRICNEELRSNQKLNMIPICKKYLRFLDNYELWDDTKAEYDVSLLLNYWLYDKISNFYSTKNIDKISVDFSALQLIWDHFKDDAKRKPYYQNFKPNEGIFKKEDWENKKKLYEYYVNYDNLFSTVQLYPNKCTEYYDYFKEMISVYKIFSGLCLSREYSCPEYFYKFQKKNPDNNIENLPCYKQIDMQKTAAARARLSREGGTSDHSPGPEVGHLKVRGASGPQGDSASTQDTQSTSQSSNIGTKVSHSVLGAAPVLLTATMLYRYTPLGPWIRIFGGGRTTSMNAMDTLSPYTQETGDMFSKDTENYISYQPI